MESIRVEIINNPDGTQDIPLPDGFAFDRDEFYMVRDGETGNIRILRDPRPRLWRNIVLWLRRGKWSF
jgi:predicted Zn-dependent protease